jgi:hypothetical protein
VNRCPGTLRGRWLAKPTEGKQLINSLSIAALLGIDG